MFDIFPTIEYPLDGYNNEVTKITTAYLLQRFKVDDAFVFQSYTLKDNENVIPLSERFYGDVEYYWTIWLANDVINPYTDWLVDKYILRDFSEKKYEGGADGIHHYYNVDTGLICDDMTDTNYRAMDPEELPAHIRPVTNYEYELDQNELKREISVIHPQAIRMFVDDFEDMFAELTERRS